MNASALVHVVAATMVDSTGAVLVQRRAEGAHQGGLWEFPGGKLESDEQPWPGLCRELREELGIQALAGRPLIAVRHDYPDRRVLLDVWRVDRWQGQPRALEDQPMRWVQPSELRRYALPAADEPVISALRLPERYLITPEPESDLRAWMRSLETAAAGGIALIALRARGLDAMAYETLAQTVLKRLRAIAPHTKLLLNAAPGLVAPLGADGVHLNAERLNVLDHRPLSDSFLVGASCHDYAQLQKAASIGADFAVLGPVNPTPSHPGAPTLGWEGFKALASHARIPVFALGGVGPDELSAAWDSGAQGIAAIRALWPGPAGKI